MIFKSCKVSLVNKNLLTKLWFRFKCKLNKRTDKEVELRKETEKNTIFQSFKFSFYAKNNVFLWLLRGGGKINSVGFCPGHKPVVGRFLWSLTRVFRGGGNKLAKKGLARNPVKNGGRGCVILQINVHWRWCWIYILKTVELFFKWTIERGGGGIYN